MFGWYTDTLMLWLAASEAVDLDDELIDCAAPHIPISLVPEDPSMVCSKLRKTLALHGYHNGTRTLLGHKSHWIVIYGSTGSTQRFGISSPYSLQASSTKLQ
ncbi:hypothetical protein BJV78DRAFT_553046 [Lactifluus subvellereus]|nr:hypothetical protein BJV78DRAFT_553046 [Lactifluus subvellereus]